MKIHCYNFLKIFILIFSLSIVSQKGNAQAVGPGDWSSVRLYGHCYALNDFTTDEYDWIKNHYTLFTIEKRHAKNVYGSVSSERASAATAAKIIANNSNASPLFYWNTKVIYDYIYETIQAALAIHPEWVVNDTWNYDDPAFRKWFVDVVKDQVNNKGHAGVFLDAAMTVAASSADKMLAMMDEMPGIVIYNGYTPRGTASTPVIAATQSYLKHADGVFVEHFFTAHCNTLGRGQYLIDSLLEVPNDKIIIAHSAPIDDYYTFTDHKFSLAAFLIIANDNSYYHFMKGGYSSEGMTYWDDDFGKYLGAPKGVAKKNGYVYTRSFANAEVKIDIRNQTSSIEWGKNIALTGTASQSSTNSDGVASRAIDGNTNGMFDDGSVSKTESEANAWWQVDLETEDSLSLISIFGRSDECCKAGETDFSVIVLNSAGDTTYKQQHFADMYPSVTIDVGGIKGKVIKIRLNEPGSLSLAEVKVFEKIQIITYNQKFIVRDSDNQPLSNANVGVNSNYQTTNDLGETIFSLQKGSYDVSVSKSGYFIKHQSYNCYSDSVIYLNMQKSIGDVEFQITDGENIIRYASIKLNSVPKHANSLGIATFFEQAVNKEYTYTIEKEGYKTVTSTFTFVNDTTIHIQLNTVTGISEAEANLFCIYPNPVNDVLSIDLSNLSMAKYELCSITGKLMLSGPLIKGENRIELGGLLPGIYMVKILMNEQVSTTKIIKK